MLHGVAAAMVVSPSLRKMMVWKMEEDGVEEVLVVVAAVARRVMECGGVVVVVNLER